MKQRSDGFVVKRPGQEIEWSQNSVLSGKRIVSGGVTVPVEGMSGVFYRLTAGEHASLTDEQRAEINRRAREAFAAKTEPKSK